MANADGAPNTKQRLHDALAYTVKEKDAKTINERLVKVMTEALVHTLVFARK